MPSSALLHILSPSIINRPFKPNKLSLFSPCRKLQRSSVKCRGSSITDFDLYELLGVDSSSDQSEIKNAYRSLQKRCHPDIAGQAGHDMAIILNEAYSVLSNPNSRYIYDKEQAKMAEFSGYSGKPLYSVWCGPETEERAVFVDEVKCVGCLKCALFAGKTFAVESVFGRARVVAQWADPEDKIQDAIQSCPVDCISIVERSNLAALEYLMSKQPRGSVRVGGGNTIGSRVSNIFVDVNKFQSRYQEMKDKEFSKMKLSKEADIQREARFSAMQAIRSFSNWLYWQAPITKTSTGRQNLKLIAEKKTMEPGTERLQEAVSKLKASERKPQTSQNQTNYKFNEEYWTPTLSLPTATQSSKKPISNSTPIHPKLVIEEDTSTVVDNNKWENPMTSIVPTVIGVAASVIVGFESGGVGSSGGITEHVGGSKVLGIVNSSLLQAILAGITWYLMGAAMVGLAQAVQSSMRK